ncbi:hypothetical protein H7Y21_03545 [Arenimonas sp.]|nr:hypothetical protein [Candidatus Parcubacteria bacterium]
MRTINKKIILLSIILAAAMVNNSNIYASTVKKSLVGKNHEVIQTNKTAIENALKNNDYALFTNTLKSLNIAEVITQDQFTVLVNAYNLFKQDKKNEAVQLLQLNKVNPILIKFINDRPDLTDSQKQILKQASDLIKVGKIEEAKALIKTAGLPEVPKSLSLGKKIMKIESKANKEEFQKAFTQARELKELGKLDEAKKVLKDAGIPDSIQEKIRPEFEKSGTTTTIGFLQTFKNLFIK